MFSDKHLSEWFMEDTADVEGIEYTIERLPNACRIKVDAGIRVLEDIKSRLTLFSMQPLGALTSSRAETLKQRSRMRQKRTRPASDSVGNAIQLLARGKIFLSHKGADKPMVQRFADLLTLLGFSPWLDVDAMPAGTDKYRGILDGFKESCAAVFVITPQFKEEAYLRNEVTYALDQKTKRTFTIISLVFENEKGEKGVVPELLTHDIYKAPKTEMEALHEIIRALPVTVGPVDWRNKS